MKVFVNQSNNNQIHNMFKDKNDAMNYWIENFTPSSPKLVIFKETICGLNVYFNEVKIGKIIEHLVN